VKTTCKAIEKILSASAGGMDSVFGIQDSGLGIGMELSGNKSITATKNHLTTSKWA